MAVRGVTIYLMDFGFENKDNVVVYENLWLIAQETLGSIRVLLVWFIIFLELGRKF